MTTLLNRLGAWFKQFVPNSKGADPRAAALFAPAYPGGGWWRDDPGEQLRH